jgi:hypothetical protein
METHMKRPERLLMQPERGSAPGVSVVIGLRRFLRHALRSAALLLGALCLITAGCIGGQSPAGEVSFNYSFWRDDGAGGFEDIDCEAAGVYDVQIDLVSGGVLVGSNNSICNAFGNRDGASTEDELGIFSAGFFPTSFDLVRVSLLTTEGALIDFGLRLDGEDEPFSPTQELPLAAPADLGAQGAFVVPMPGEAGVQVAQELQIVILR